MFASILLLVGLSACDNGPGVIYEPPDTSEDADTDCPVIEHTPVETTQVYGEPVPIQATVTDEGCGVFFVKVYYRQETSTTWVEVGLTRGEGDTFTGEIPGVDVRTGGMYYYLYAVDSCENACYLPTSGENDAWHFRISA